MNWVWYCIEISVNIIEVGLYLFLINSKFPNRTKSVWPYLIALFVGTAGLSYIGLCHVTWIPDYLFETGVVFLYALTTRKGKFLQKLFWIVIGITLICAAGIIGISSGMLLPGVTMDIILRQQSVARIQVLIVCKLLQTIIFFILALRKESQRLISLPVMILLIFLSATSFSTVLLLLEYGLGPDPSTASQFLMLGASMSVLAINLVVFVLYESLSRQAENNLQMQAKIQQNDMLMRHSEEITGLYDEMRGWRHDYHNHLQVIHGYLQLKKYEKLGAYLEQIERSITGMGLPVNSGNLLIDAIVGSKILFARNQNIQTDADIEAPSDLKMNDTDLSALLGNLLDNAVEACQRIADPGAKRFVEIEIRIIKGHLHVKVRNSTNGALRMQGANFLTDKSGRHHGVGIKHIDEITAKYGGYISRSHENCCVRDEHHAPTRKNTRAFAAAGHGQPCSGINNFDFLRPVRDHLRTTCSPVLFFAL